VFYIIILFSLVWPLTVRDNKTQHFYH